MLLKIAFKNLILGMNLTKVEKDLYNEKHKTMGKEIEDDTKRW
jgi:hypothetical protein